MQDHSHESISCDSRVEEKHEKIHLNDVDSLDAFEVSE